MRKLPRNELWLGIQLALIFGHNCDPDAMGQIIDWSALGRLHNKRQGNGKQE